LPAMPAPAPEKRDDSELPLYENLYEIVDETDRWRGEMK